MANPDGVLAGVGLLYVAPVGTTAPTDATTALNAAFRAVGYTEAGATVTTAVEQEDLEVAEELEPIGTSTTKRTGSISFEMAETLRNNLALALNLGADDDVDATTVIEPPDPADEVYVSIVLQTNQNARWYFPKAKNTGEFSMARAKTGKTLIGVEFGLFKPASLAIFRVWPGTDGAI